MSSSARPSLACVFAWRWVSALPLVALLVAASAAVSAAEIKVLAAGALKSTLSELVPRYESVSGDTVSIVYGNAGAVRSRLDQGEVPDVVMLPSDALNDVAKRGLVQESSRANLAAVAIGVAIAKGAPAPDISTPEALRRALLAAKAVAYSDPARATSGKHFDTVVLPALGITDQVHAKARLQGEGSAAEFVRRGEADIAVQQVSELLAVEGVSVVGPLPASLQKITVYGAAVAAGAHAKDSARKLVAYLTSPESRQIFRNKGMDAPL